jgi:hypothetical protein
MTVRYYFFVSIYLLCSWMKLSAQQYEIKWSEFSSAQNIKYIGEEKGQNKYVLIEQYDTGIYLKKLNTDGKTVFSKKILHDFDFTKYKSLHVRSRICFKNRFLILCEFLNSESKYEFYIASLSYSGDELSPSVKLFEVESKFVYSMISELNISPDSSKIMLCGNISLKKQNIKNKIFLRLIDADLSKIISKDISLDVNSNFDIDAITNGIVTNIGVVYIWGLKFDNKTKLAMPCLWTYNVTTDSLAEIRINFEGKFVDNLLCKEDQVGRVIVTGVYYNLNNITDFSSRPYDGIFHSVLNSDSINNVTYSEIPKGVEKINPEFKILFKDFTFVYKDDGGTVMLFEHKMKFGSSMNQYLGNIFIIDCDEKGSINYCISILKQQAVYITAPTLAYSYVPFYNNHDRKLRIVFNAKLESTIKKVQDETFHLVFPKKAIPVMVTVEKGNLSMSTFTKTADIVLLPKASYQISDKKKLFIGVFGKKALAIGLSTF